MNTREYARSFRELLPMIGVSALLGGVIALAGNFALHRDESAIDPAIEENAVKSARGADPDSPRPRSYAVTVPAGTQLAIQLGETLSTKTTTQGEHFVAHVAEPIVLSGRTVIPAGALVQGVVSESARSKRIGGRARMTLELTGISVSGRERPLSASYTALGKKQTARDAATIGGSTAGGAILGRIIGHQRGEDARGTTLGAVVGGAVGTGVALANRAPHVVLPAGSTITVTLDSSMTV